MPALDTNVLVRFLVQDDGAQLQQAKALLERCVAAGELLFVPVTVALELEWVLRSRYGFPKESVTAVFAALLSSAQLQFESETALEIALARYNDGAADFADCVHIALATQAGHSPLWTFDKTAAKVDGARLLA